MKNLKQPIITIIIGIAVLAGVNALFAWTEPTQAPPGGNVAAPINVSSASQYKSGALGVGGVLEAFSDICLGGVCRNTWPEGGGASNYGGSYTVQDGGACVRGNPLAGGGCGCPAGYTATCYIGCFPNDSLFQNMYVCQK